MNFAKNLKEIREFLGISQTELGKRCGLKACHISHFETENREPNIQNLSKIAKGLGVTTDRLLQDPTNKKLESKQTN